MYAHARLVSLLDLYAHVRVVARPCLYVPARFLIHAAGWGLPGA